MGNHVFVTWWQVALEPVQVLVDWQKDFAATWMAVYMPSGTCVVKPA